MGRTKGSQNKASDKSKQGYITLGANEGKYRARVSKKVASKSHIFSLGIDESKDNYVDAMNLINKIEEEMLKDIEAGIFDHSFEKYKPSKILDKNTIKTAQYYLDNFESRYFAGKRKRDPQSEETFRKSFQKLKYYLKGKESCTFNLKLIEETILVTEFGTDTRHKRVSYLSSFCNLYPELQKMIQLNNFNFNDYKGDYEAESRDIPPDEMVIEGFNKIQIKEIQRGYPSESWGWVYGVLATYGLRPHEILAIDFNKSFKPPSYEIYLDENLCEGIKTGSRFVPPIPEEWVHTFGLADVNLSQERKEILTQILKGKKARGTKDNFADANNGKFRNVNIGFQPYDLRHAYAIRGYLFGFTISQMAKFMGHSTIMHEKIYQKYLPDDQKLLDYRRTYENYKLLKKMREGKRSYEELETELNKVNLELQLMRDNLAKCQQRNQELEQEIVRLKAIEKVLKILESKGNSSTLKL
ncbi:hypothetical protein NIES2101_38155 [Calothrix sp. HK-06]|nr:hypothetical protein NIES2101_38155 [Calothrix sp. HK-06]